MIYEFRCYPCELDNQVDSRPFRPPSPPTCLSCGELMDRVFGCEINTAGCQDVDHIPEKDRIACGGTHANLTPGQATALEAKHQAHIEKTRRELADGGNRGSIRKTQSIPAALYHGKIKQTGDRHYWDDPKNRNRHKSTKVS